MPKILLLVSFMNFSVDSAMSSFMVNVLQTWNVKIGKHTGISSVTKK